MTADEMLRMWLTDHMKGREGQAAACASSYRSGRLAVIADRMASVHLAAAEVYRSALAELLSPPQKKPTDEGGRGGGA